MANRRHRLTDTDLDTNHHQVHHIIVVVGVGIETTNTIIITIIVIIVDRERINARINRREGTRNARIVAVDVLKR